jgi:lysophospholipase L1-like esterase
MKKLIALFVLALLGVVLAMGASVFEDLNKTATEDPSVWEDDIIAFDQLDAQQAPPQDAVVFVGSSSIRLWENLAQDMAPLPIIQRGFGGSRMQDVLHYADRLITRYRPSQVVIFVGSNDINVSDTPMDAVPLIRDGLEQLIRIISASRADTRIFYIDITATPYAWEKQAAIVAANAATREVCEQHPQVQCIATQDLFLDADGEPKGKLFVFDGLHLSPEGYALWTSRIRPLLMPELLTR